MSRNKLTQEMLRDILGEQISKTLLTKEQMYALQEKIVREHWFPYEEHFSLHVYEARWDIEGEKYISYKAIGYNQEPEFYRVGIND
jgi:hypothetical protein